MIEQFWWAPGIYPGQTKTIGNSKLLLLHRVLLAVSESGDSAFSALVAVGRDPGILGKAGFGYEGRLGSKGGWHLPSFPVMVSVT